MTKVDHAYLDRVAEYGPIARSLSTCLRPTFTAEDGRVLVWGDWSAIEARVLPWLAGSRGSRAVLDVFETVDADPDAPDIYMIAAAAIYNIPAHAINERVRNGDKDAKNMRQVGKVAVLALGFGGGVGALMSMATTYGLYFSEGEAQRIVDIWRADNKWAVAFWAKLNEAFFDAYHNPGVVYEAGLVAYIHDPSYLGGTTFVALPCGRLLSYTSMRFRDIERVNRTTGETYTQKTMTYRKGYTWGSIWHGILAENVTQAAAASVLRAKLRHIEHDSDAPLVVRGHTHDEIITECDDERASDARAYLKRVMEDPLEWSDGLPLAAEVTSNWYYTKALD